MKVTILGSGNVAEAIAAAVAKRPGNSEPHEIWARSGRGAEIAEAYGFTAAASPGTLMPADIYIMAVSDDAIPELSMRMNVPGHSVVAHTAGGVGIDAIQASTNDKAVFYPLQTFSAGRPVDFRHVPVFLEWTTPHAGDTVREFAAAIYDDINEADSRRRIKLHTAAVFACNFTNELYSKAAALIRDEGLSSGILKPLVEETVAKAFSVSDPSAVQTGPAVRGDNSTKERHLALLKDEDRTDYIEIYELLSKSIWETSKKI